MQIDFHHAVTYIAARAAGFPHQAAHIIAWSAQYVDDATDEGYVAFDNRGMYGHIASAHKMLDYRNFVELANHRAWVPFHFLPGNEGLPAGEGNEKEFTHRLICRRDSHVARAMVDHCIQLRDRTPYHLYQLGIAMHVYADTWAHHGFSGITHRANEVRDLRDATGEPYRKMIRHINDYYSGWSRAKNRVKSWLGIDPDETATELINDFLPLGHGAALSVPDRPYLVWSYRNGLGQAIHRDNPAEYLAAADALCKAMQRYLGSAPTGLPVRDRDAIEELLRNITDDDRRVRHRRWLAEIKKGRFSFGAANELDYVESGEGSWKWSALGDGALDDDEMEFIYSHQFLSSDWKLFHDALQAHRLFVLHELLPRFGICAA